MGKSKAVDEIDHDVPGAAYHDENAVIGTSARTSRDELVTVFPAEGTQQATAAALLDAADDPADVVWSPDEGGFVVPPEVADRADLPESDGDDSDGPPAKGATKATWLAYAQSQGVDVDENATKAEIVAAVEAAS
jgi:hypothetical protein